MQSGKVFPSVRKASPRVVVARILIIVAMIANLTFIWINSSQGAKDSTKASHSIGHSIASRSVDGYQDLSQSEKTEKLRSLDPQIRNAAHIIEYFPLGILIFLLTISVFVAKSSEKKKLLFLVLLDVFVAFVFAMTDEIHQIFVKGRSFELKDVGMDMLGMFLGYIAVAVGIYLSKLIKQKNTD